ncbi:MAG TPA: TspO/MBR family protein, partial [Gemmatimonadaceae bacterium]|nr:TspO/MBR family protein [Gemmatimonadaceae bacterium]
RVLGLLASLLLCFATAAIGALATRSAPEFYAALTRPTWAPPASVFGPVWTLLYALMAVAAWLVGKERGLRAARLPLGLFAVQLVLNALWSWLFFAWRRGLLAEVEIVVLLALIALTLVAFWRVRPVAGVLLLPYLLWVGYATALTFALVGLNPALFDA